MHIKSRIQQKFTPNINPNYSKIQKGAKVRKTNKKIFFCPLHGAMKKIGIAKVELLKNKCLVHLFGLLWVLKPAKAWLQEGSHGGEVGPQAVGQGECFLRASVRGNVYIVQQMLKAFLSNFIYHSIRGQFNVPQLVCKGKCCFWGSIGSGAQPGTYVAPGTKTSALLPWKKLRQQ